MVEICLNSFTKSSLSLFHCLNLRTSDYHNSLVKNKMTSWPTRTPPSNPIPFRPPLICFIINVCLCSLGDILQCFSNDWWPLSGYQSCKFLLLSFQSQELLVLEKCVILFSASSCPYLYSYFCSCEAFGRFIESLWSSQYNFSIVQSCSFFNLP